MDSYQLLLSQIDLFTPRPFNKSKELMHFKTKLTNDETCEDAIFVQPNGVIVFGTVALAMLG